MARETAPLLDIPEAPRPPRGEAHWFHGADGARLRAALFRPAGRARGCIVLSGGRTEPIEKYYETIEDLTGRGFVVLAHDWRGQGLSDRALSDRLKGHARGFDAFIDDFRRLLDAYEGELPRPWVAVAHSMGGCLTLLALAHGERRFSGAVLSAPMLGLKFGKFPPIVARLLCEVSNLFGKAGDYVLGDPGKPFDDTFAGNPLTHDRVRFDRHRAQIRANRDLALGPPTWGWLDFAMRATDDLAQPWRLASVDIPVEIVSAAEDALVDNLAQEAAARHLPFGRFTSVAGANHELLMETDEMRNIFLRVLDALLGRAAPAEPAPAPPPEPASAPQAVAATPEPPAPVKPEPKAPRAKAAPKAKAAKPAAAKPAKAAAKPKPAAKAPAKAAAPAKAVVAKKAPVKKAAARSAPAKAVKAPAPKAAAAPGKSAAAKKAPSNGASTKATAAKKAPAAKKAAAAKKPTVVKKAPAAKAKAPAKKPAK